MLLIYIWIVFCFCHVANLYFDCVLFFVMLLICVQVTSCDKALRVYRPISLISLPLLNTVALIYLQIQTLNVIFIKTRNIATNKKEECLQISMSKLLWEFDLKSECLVLAVSIPLSPLNAELRLRNDLSWGGLVMPQPASIF